MKLLTMLLILGSLSLPPSIFAEDVFVQTADEFRQAIIDAKPGRTIIIRDGTYNDWGSFTISSTQDGTADSPLTIRGETTGGVIFEGTSALSLIIRSRYFVLADITFQGHGQFDTFGETTTGQNGVLIFDGAQDVTVDGVTFQDIHGGGVAIPIMEYLGNRETRRLTFQNIELDDYIQEGRSAFVYIYGGTARGTPRDIVWRDSVFRNRECTTTVQYCYLFKVGDSADSLAYNSGLVFDGNTFQTDALMANGQDLMYLQGTAITMTNNVFEGVGAVNFRAGDGHLIARNTFIDPISLQGAAINIHGAAHEIVSNACMSMSHSRTCLNLGKGTVDSGDGGVGPDYKAFQDSLIAHNSFSGFRDAAITMAQDHVGAYDGRTTVFPTGIEFHNNMVSQAEGTMFIGNDCASEFAAISHNGRSGVATAGCMSAGTNNTTTAPQWKVNSVNPIYGSPLINAGVALPDYASVNIDILGLRRDSSPDIGAAEWGGQVVPDGSETAADVCNRLFGETPNYLLCEATEEACSFNVLLAGSSCSDLCTSQGKSCVGAFETEGLSCVETFGGTDDCNTVRSTDEICICESEDPDDPPTPRTVQIRYVDSSCVEQGNGITATCGANGPWNSLEYALNTVKCIGMQADDVLLVKGTATVPADGNWYGGVFHQAPVVSPDSACSGIVIQNIDDEHVVVDGTIDIVGSVWVHIGNDVYECQGANCGTKDNFPFTAWVGISGTEYQLELIQTVRVCEDTLAAGKMTYSEKGRRVCVHLPDDSNPADADYVRIPYYGSAFDISQQAVSGVIFRENPGGGSFTVTRYRDRLFNMTARLNSGITIDGLELSQAMDRAINVSGSEGEGGFNFVNNHIHHIGQDGISWVKDFAFSIISNNEIHDIGMAPLFEQCSGVGDGCLGGYINPPNAIRVNNCTPDDLSARSLISNNEIYNIGSGLSGVSYGIHLQYCSYFNKIDSNLIYDSSASALGFRAIMFSGFGEEQFHDKNVITNTRCENADICLATSYEPWEKAEDDIRFADQTGRRNYFFGNTCYNPLVNCWLQESGGETTGELILGNNLAVSDAGYVLLMDVGDPTFWDNEFRYNGFQCSHTDCIDEVIAEFKGLSYKRDGDCTEGTDCVSDMASGAGNLYGVFDVQTATMALVSGSDAVNTAENLDLLPTDYTGSRRPLGLTSDMGAHEFSGFSFDVSLTQGIYRLYERFDIDGTTPIAEENDTAPIHTESQFTLRIGVYGNPDSYKDIVHLALYAQHCDPTCGSYVPVTLNCEENAICMIDNPAHPDGHPLSPRLNLSGRRFLETSNYADGEASTERNGHLIGASEQVDLEYALAIGAVAVGDVINLRVYYTSGAALEDYIVTPSLTIGETFNTVNINR